MHNLAIALKREGHHVTGSDDKIFDPSRTRLEREGLLPEEEGWFPERLDENIDVIILGMHARPDNPELLKAQKAGMNIQSYPEFLFEHSKEKQRVVIGGSHGKTSVTAMILHVLADVDMDVDYMVGAQLDGYDCMVRLSEAPVIIMEGDEYLSSPIDRRPKFHWYEPHIAVLTGIAWDHINVFPTFEGYVSQFEYFVKTMPNEGRLFYYGGDEELVSAVSNSSDHIQASAYGPIDYEVRGGVTYAKHSEEVYPLQIFGAHNMQNLQASMCVCRELGVSEQSFLASIGSFTGAARRLELVKKTEGSVMYKDFAHSPSKLKATTSALKEQYPERRLVACMELHTFSSLNKAFLDEYTGAMDSADVAVVFYDPEVVKQKKLESFDPSEVRRAFGRDDIQVVHDAQKLQQILDEVQWNGTNLLMMSSGNFGGIDIEKLGETLIA